MVYTRSDQNESSNCLWSGVNLIIWLLVVFSDWKLVYNQLVLLTDEFMLCLVRVKKLASKGESLSVFNLECSFPWESTNVRGESVDRKLYSLVKGAQLRIEGEPWRLYLPTQDVLVAP